MTTILKKKNCAVLSIHLIIFLKFKLISKNAESTYLFFYLTALAGFFFCYLGNVTKSFDIDVHFVRDVDRGTGTVRADFFSRR